MKYTVTWLASAEDELAAIWIAAEDRSTIATAAGAIDRQLHRDPSDAGESREPGWRILLMPPLGVKFVYSEADRLVTVARVWRFR